MLTASTWVKPRRHRIPAWRKVMTSQSSRDRSRAGSDAFLASSHLYHQQVFIRLNSATLGYSRGRGYWACARAGVTSARVGVTRRELWLAHVLAWRRGVALASRCNGPALEGVTADFTSVRDGMTPILASVYWTTVGVNWDVMSQRHKLCDCCRYWPVVLRALNFLTWRGVIWDKF